MRSKNPILIGALAGTMLAMPALAATTDPDCLQHNRMVSWRALDDRTLVFTDRQMKQYTAQMQDACENILLGDTKLVFETWTNLSCLQQGMIVHVVGPGVRGTCAIGSVHAGGPPAGR